MTSVDKRPHVRPFLEDLRKVRHAARRVNLRSLRDWARIGLVHTRLLDSEVEQSTREMMYNAFHLTSFSKVEGDYLEFGVFWGNSFIKAWNSARLTGRNSVRFYAFDSFAGLPDPKGIADDGGEFLEGDFSCDRDAFERNLRRAGVDMSRVKIVEGFYETSLEKNKPGDIGIEAASVVWIDCDLYSSTIIVLDYITDLVRDGTVLIFDDWYCFHGRPDRGEQRACAEWLERNPGIALVPYRDFHWAGTSFLVNLVATDA